MSSFLSFVFLNKKFGHNLGASHDGYGNSCPLTGYIMQAQASPYQEVTGFSTCSQTDISSYLQQTGLTCADTIPSTTYVCGNGIVEEGEDCDAGSLGVPSNSSCCTTTCRFASGAVCDASNGACCDSLTCQFQPAAFVCRNVTAIDPFSSCDVADVCSGYSALCDNKWKLDGSQCSTNTSTDATTTATMTGRCQYGTFESGPSLNSKCQSREAECIAQNSNAVYDPSLDPTKSCTLTCSVNGVAINFLKNSLTTTVNTPDYVRFSFILFYRILRF